MTMSLPKWLASPVLIIKGRLFAGILAAGHQPAAFFYLEGEAGISYDDSASFEGSKPWH
jgi:hypothetical protein